MKNITYTYADLVRELSILSTEFPNADVFSIGKSVWGRDIFCIKIGHGANRLSYNGAHHGMEYITSALLMTFARDFLRAEASGDRLGGYPVRTLAKKATVYIVPMLNPDGVDLAVLGIPDNLSADAREQLRKICPTGDFSSWQANARGVDLNHNYDAEWLKSKQAESEHGVFAPCATRFSGEYAESEPESRALANFTRLCDFHSVIAFHSQGKVIYHGFLGKEPPLSARLARTFELISPYKSENVCGIASYGGYKDWFVKHFNRAGFTVEVSLGKNPISLTRLPEVYRDTLPILLGAMTVPYRQIAANPIYAENC